MNHATVRYYCGTLTDFFYASIGLLAKFSSQSSTVFYYCSRDSDFVAKVGIGAGGVSNFVEFAGETGSWIMTFDALAGAGWV